MLNIEKYYNDNCFKLPIEFLEKKIPISKQLQEDLELIKNNDSENTNPTSYDLIFKPNTKIGKKCLSIWANQFTTDKQFIKESQQLYKNANALHQDKDLLDISLPGKINNVGCVHPLTKVIYQVESIFTKIGRFRPH